MYKIRSLPREQYAVVSHEQGRYNLLKFKYKPYIYIYIYIYIDTCIGLQIIIFYSSSLLFIPLGSSVWSMCGWVVPWYKFNVVKCVVITGEMFRNSCLFWRRSGFVNRTSVIVLSLLCIVCCIVYSVLISVNKIFWLTVNIVWDLSCLFSRWKRVASSSVSYVIACEAVSSSFVWSLLRGCVCRLVGNVDMTSSYKYVDEVVRTSESNKEWSCEYFGTSFGRSENVKMLFLW